MGKPRNLLQETAQVLGDKTYTAVTPCVCGCDQCYTTNGACVECTKQRSRDRYATPEGKRAQRDGDARRYRNRIASKEVPQ